MEAERFDKEEVCECQREKKHQWSESKNGVLGECEKKHSSVIDVFQKGGKVLFDVGDSPRSIFVSDTKTIPRAVRAE